MFKSRTFGAVFLVSGMAIGAAMLALPIKTGVCGILPASVIMCISCLFMTLTLFFLLEATMMSEVEGADFVTMCRERFGAIGEIASWLTFLLLLYSITAAYLSGGGALISSALSVMSTKFMSGGVVHPDVGVMVFLGVFGLLLVFGVRTVDSVNRVCMFGLVASFVILSLMIVNHVDINNYSGGELKYMAASVPIIILSFTSHVMVPSLKGYLHGNVRSLKIALSVGMAIPLILYLVWEFMIVGVLPIYGSGGLKEIGGAAHPLAEISYSLNSITGAPWIGLVVGVFSFFAIVTSFFGAVLSLQSFLADGFRVRHCGLSRRFCLLLGVLVPPAFFALFYPKAFSVALEYAGVLVALLYGIVPALMVWKGRYVDMKSVGFRVIGGRPMVIFTCLVSLFIVLAQCASTKGWIPVL